MRRIFYISPYFPPQTRVGALRPLRFLRHLAEFGYGAVVLCDLRKSDPIDDRLAEAVPDSVVVVRDYSRHARAAERAWRAGTHRPDRPPPGERRGLERYLPRFLDNPELIPLGRHSLDLSHAWRAAGRVLREHDAQAIVVNADPFVATLVGARLAEETRLPLVLDLRDPWALCELRRPLRPALSRWIVDRLERWALSAARAVVLTSERSCADYRSHYSDFDARRFHVIRNSSDPELIGHGSHPGFDRYTMLHLGGFRRFISGNVLLDLLSALRQRGLHPDAFQLVVTGNCPVEVLAEARRRGVDDMLRRHPYVSYTELGPVMDAADLLVTLLNPNTIQRLPTKLYDYAQSHRPILAIAQNPELHQLCAELGGARCYEYTELDRVTDYVLEEVSRGRQQEAERSAQHLSSAAAAQKLAAALESVIG